MRKYPQYTRPKGADRNGSVENIASYKSQVTVNDLAFTFPLPNSSGIAAQFLALQLFPNSGFNKICQTAFACD